jgi:zinc transport system ATP-binding protein
MKTPALELRDVWFSFRGQPALEGVELTVEENDYLAILGPNGSGKTTLLKIILGLLEPHRGTVRVLGKPPTEARGQVGYVPQHAVFDLHFPIRVLDVVLMGRLGSRKLLLRQRPEDLRLAMHALERVEMTQFCDRPIGSLSGGELQRVLIARALTLQPSLLLLDEPTASLDEKIGRSVWELFEELSHDMTVVLVSHDIGAISQYVRTVACLNRRLYSHPSKHLTPDALQAVYGCPVELLAHGQPHRVLAPHDEAGGE